MPYKDPEDQRRRNQTYQQTHKTEIKQQRLAYREANKEEHATYMRTYWEANREALLAYHRAYRESHKEESANYYATHRKEKIASGRTWRATHKKQRAIYDAAYAAAHKPEGAIKSARRRAIKRNAPVNDFSVGQWTEIQAMQDHRCYYCKKRRKGRLTQDHITPLAQGGSHTASNIVAACLSCNSKKLTGPPPIPVQPLLLTIAPGAKHPTRGKV